MKSDLRGIGLALPGRLAALVAHALHDGVEVGRAGTGLQRPVGELRVERLVEIDAAARRRRPSAGAAEPASGGASALLLAAEGARQAAEHRAAAAGRFCSAACSELERRDRGGGGGFGRRALTLGLSAARGVDSGSTSSVGDRRESVVGRRRSTARLSSAQLAAPAAAAAGGRGSPASPAGRRS